MKTLLKTVLCLFLVMFWVSTLFRSCSGIFEATTLQQEEEFDMVDSLNSEIQHHRLWTDFYNEVNYGVKYAVGTQAEMEAVRHRENFSVEYYETDQDFWQQVYYGLYEQNKTKLGFIQDSLRHIGDSLRLSRDDFARMVVSFVQDIPYQYILPDSCGGHNDFPCNANVKYGILSQVEFLSTLRGDCDTRTVLLFTLLRNFGYEPVIINSQQYLHSMLALDIPTTGEYLTHRGKRYAFWETTNVGWLPGMLPPDMNNTSYWNVILDL